MILRRALLFGFIATVAVVAAACATDEDVTSLTTPKPTLVPTISLPESPEFSVDSFAAINPILKFVSSTLKSI
jgi:hypothetical protein